MRVVRDDGAIVYLNGEEIFRQSMPDGAVDYQTYANVTASGINEDTFFSQAVEVLTLVPGTNVLAAEIHQRNATSSDISFDAELVLTSTLRAPAVSRIRGRHPRSGQQRDLHRGSGRRRPLGLPVDAEKVRRSPGQTELHWP